MSCSGTCRSLVNAQNSTMPAEPRLPYAPEHAFQFLVRAASGSDTRVFEVEVTPGVTLQVRTWHPKEFKNLNAKFPGISFKYHDCDFCVHTLIKGDQNYFCMFERTVWGTYGFIGDRQLRHTFCLDIQDSARDLMRVFVGSNPQSPYPHPETT